MYYDCISVDILNFLKQADEEPTPSAVVENFVRQAAACKQYFRFPLVDIGPSEAFAGYHTLCTLVPKLKAVGFSPRLLTTGRYFADSEGVVGQFVELAQLGAQRIVLRANRLTAESLPQSHVANYVNACSASGITCDIRLDLEEPIAESLLQLVRWVEEASFYTTIYMNSCVNAEHRKFAEGIKIEGYGTKKMRVVISQDGSVLLREYDPKVIETYLGSMLQMPLAEIIHPRRIGPADEPANGLPAEV